MADHCGASTAEFFSALSQACRRLNQPGYLFYILGRHSSEGCQGTHTITRHRQALIIQAMPALLLQVNWQLRHGIHGPSPHRQTVSSRATSLGKAPTPQTSLLDAWTASNTLHHEQAPLHSHQLMGQHLSTPAVHALRQDQTFPTRTRRLSECSEA